MATAGEIAEVRENTNEPTQANFTDSELELLIDSFPVGSVALASATVWRRKAAKAADLVDVSEAGASRKMSDLFKHAQEMATYWQAIGDEQVTEADTTKGRAKVHPIVRTS